MKRNGQAWSLDYTLSLLMFIGAMVVGYTMITNTLSDRSFEHVRQQAIDASDIIASEGYPRHWTAENAIRAGLLANGQLSPRKVHELTKLSDDKLRQALRITDNLFMYVLNSSGELDAAFGNCTIGDYTVPGNPANRTVPAVALVGPTHPFVDLMNVGAYDNGTGMQLARRSDVIFIEGNFSGTEIGQQMQWELERVAARGVTFLILGDPGILFLGLELTPDTASQLSVQNITGAELGLGNETLDIRDGGASVDFMTVINNAEMENFFPIAYTENGQVAYASWTFNDAEVFYLAVTEGLTESGNPLQGTIANATFSMVNASHPDCNLLTHPASAKQLAFQDRVISYHDEPLTVRTVVWRN